MATYSNPHWLLCHIRNSFISTDNTGMCETVMVSDDLPKHYMRKFQANCLTRSMQLHKKRQEVMNMINQIQQNQQQLRKKQRELKQEQQKIQQQKQQHQHIQQQQQQIQELQKEIEELQPQIDNLQQQILQILQQEEKRNCDPNLKEVDFICYPDLDESDDEDVDLTAQSFDIQMYPEIGAHRFRSNTAQKLEKMDIARRKAAKTKCVNYDDEIMQPERHDFFVRKSVGLQEQQTDVVKSKLTLQLENSPKQLQNKFQEFAKFDGTSQTGVQTKRINVFLSMLSEKERNYPIKICVLSHAKISDVIGLVCYKATIEFPHLCLKSIRHYGLYMTEDNDDLEDFPPLDHREPCSKFGFSHLTLAEKRHLATDIRIDNGQSGVSTKSMTSEEEKAKLAAMALHSLNCSGVGADGFHSPEDKDDFESGNNLSGIEGRVDDLEQRILSQDDMLEAPVYRSYNLNIIDKKFFKTEVSLGISGERIEIDQQKNAKFWTKQRAVTYPIDAVAHCEIVEKRTMKAVLRIWLKTSSSISSSTFSDNKISHSVPAHSPSSPGHYPHFFSPFNFLNTSSTSSSSHHIRFKHYDFETTVPMAEQIYKKLSCILDMCSSDVRREFLQIKQRKLEKSQAKKHLKL